MVSSTSRINVPRLLDLPQEIFEQILDLVSSCIPDAINLLQTNHHIFNANYARVYRKYIQEKDNRDFLCSWAALRGFIGIVDFILHEGLHVNSLIPCYDPRYLPGPKSASGSSLPHSLTLLHLSIIGNQPNLSRWLLDRDADPTIIGIGPEISGTSITTAIMYDSKLSSSLVGSWIKERYTTTSALYHSIKKGRIDLVENLHQRGADINNDTGNNGSPLTTALEARSREMVEFLVNLGASVNAGVTSRSGRSYNQRISPILAAAVSTDEDMVQFLVSHGADINKVIDGDVLTPLGVAVHNNDHAAARLLLKYGADPDARNSTAWTPYGMALRRILNSRCRDNDMLDLLVAHGADPNLHRWNQPPTIFLAIQLDLSLEGDGEIFRRILDHGVDLEEGSRLMVSQTTENDRDIPWTALHECLWPLDTFSGRRHKGMQQMSCHVDRWQEPLLVTLLDRGADPLSGHRETKDIDKTPMVFFMRTLRNELRENLPVQQVFTKYEYHLSAMLMFLDHPRGGQSTEIFSVELMAELLSIVMIIPLSCCSWYGTSRRARLLRFANKTGAEGRWGKSGVSGLMDLIMHPGYWSLWKDYNRDMVLLDCLREGAAIISGNRWSKVDLELPDIPGQFISRKRRHEDD